MAHDLSKRDLRDGVVHHADVVAIEGESYRLRESQNDAKDRKAKRLAK